MERTIAYSSRTAALTTLHKAASLLLVVFLLLTPFSSVLGQEVDTSEAVFIEHATAQEIPAFAREMLGAKTDNLVAADSLQPANDETVSPETQNSEMSARQSPQARSANYSTQSTANTPTGEDAASLQDMVYLSDSHQVSGQGDYQYSYELPLPPGRSGLNVNVALSYSSQESASFSPFGVGWDINIPTITRTAKYGVDQLYNRNDFSSSFDGELVQASSSKFVPRVENGSFMRYEYQNNTWTVTDKTGVVYRFGKTPTARLDDPNDQTQIYSWYLEEIEDTNGNKVKYTYQKINGAIYPETISYAFANNIPLYEVDFILATSTAATSYETGFAVTQNHIVDSIQVTEGGALIKELKLDHETSLKTILQQLKSLKLFGYEQGVSTELDIAQFVYNESAGNSDWDADSSYVNSIPDDFYTYYYDDPSDNGSRPYYKRVTFEDVNGDGLNDWIQGSTVYLNTGSGFDDGTNFPALPFSDLHERGRMVDINGDLLPDILQSEYYLYHPDWSTNSYAVTNVWLNNGDGTWSKNEGNWNTTMPDEFYLKIYTAPGDDFEVKEYETQIPLTDMNGDGLTDWVSGDDVYLNTGNGWESAPSWINLPLADFYKSSRIADINNDNLPDLIKAHKRIWDPGDWPNKGTEYLYEAWLSDGNGGWTSDDAWADSIGTSNQFKLEFMSLDPDNQDTYYYNRPLVDINGDGWIDWLAYNEAFLNTGNGWEENASITNLPTGESNFVKDYRLVDVNGDTMPDVVRSRYEWWHPTWSRSSEEIKDVWLNTYDDSVRMKEAKSQYGGTTSVSYTHSAKAKDGAILNPDSPVDIAVVDVIASDDQQGTIATTTYKYKNASYYYGGPRDKRFAGFGEVIKINPDDSIVSTKYHQANGQGGNEPVDAYAKIGKPYERTISDSLENIYSRIRTNYTESSIGANASSTLVASEVTYQPDGVGADMATAEGYEYDNFGNALKHIQYGTVAGNQDGTFTDTGIDKRTIERTYTTNMADYIVGLPTSEVLKDNGGAKQAETLFQYNTNGNLTKNSRWISGALYADTTYTYTALGLPYTATDSLGNTTTYTYDSHSLYPATITNALNQSTQYEYDYSSGKQARVEDANGTVMEYYYDGLDRLIKEERTIANSTPETVRIISYNFTSTPAYQVETLYRNNTDMQSIYTYLDGFGRPFYTYTETDLGWAAVSVGYDVMGRKSAVSLPYNYADANSGDVYTYYSYDPLGRVTAVSNARGATHTDYSGFTTFVRDTLNNTKIYTIDAFQNLSAVKEQNNGNTYTTTYQYNTQNNLTKITDAEGNVRNIAHDALGRRISLEDLHTPSDTTFGIHTYEYNTQNLTSHTNPDGAQVSYIYDTLNRVLEENSNSTVATDITYAYDTCTYGIGKVCAITTPDAITAYDYFKSGQVDTETVTIDGTEYSKSTTYNYQGQPLSKTYPNSDIVTYTYNTEGLPVSVAINGTVEASATYGIHGLPLTTTFANGAVTTNTYDEDNLYALTQKHTTAPDTSSASSYNTTASTNAESQSENFGMGGPGPAFALLTEEFMRSGTQQSLTAKLTPSLEKKMTPTTSLFVLPIKTPTSTPTTTSVVTAPVTPPATSTSVTIPKTTTPKSTATTSTSTKTPATTTPAKVEVKDVSLLDKVVSKLPLGLGQKAKMKIAVAERLEYVAAEKAAHETFSETADTFELEVTPDIAPGVAEKIKIKATKNKPKVTLQKWDGEVDLSISYNDFANATSSVYGDNVVRWTSEKDEMKEVHAYPLPESEEIPGGGFEIEVILKEKPASNVFEFAIDGAENLDFFYQKPLTKEQTEKGYVRPENVVGSYAVYHKNKKDHTLGGTNYGTGKAFHIYRPKVSDASGNTIWGKLTYKKGKLSVTVPQEFLNTAEYPVVVDPTFGNSNIGASTDRIAQIDTYSSTSSIDIQVGSTFSSQNASGTISSLSAYISHTNAENYNSVKAIVYEKDSISAGVHGFVAQSERTDISVADLPGWIEFNFAGGVIQPNTEYVLSVIGDDDSIVSQPVPNTYYSIRVAYDDDVSENNHWQVSDYYSVDNSDWSWTPGSYAHEKFSVFVTIDSNNTTLNESPIVPTKLEVDSTTGTPKFSATFNDLDTNDTAVFYQIQVADNASFINPVWDSGKQGIAAIPEGDRSPQISYTGGGLTQNTIYYWRIKFWDQSNTEGVWGSSAAKTESFEDSFLPQNFNHIQTDAADWIQSSAQTFDGVFAAKAAAITDGEYSYLNMQVPATGTLSFSWKVSSEQGYDTLCWRKNNLDQECISGEVDWNTITTQAESGDEIAWMYRKDGSVSSGSDAGWIDLVEYPTAATFSISASSTPSQTNVEGFENTFLPPYFTHKAGNTADWFKSVNQAYAGTHSAEAGDINDNEESGMIFAAPADGDLSFYWKVSSEEGWDFLCWEQNAVEQTCISGEVDWTEVTTSVTAGDTITFTYRKDSSVSNGSDTAWVDVVSFPAGNGTTTPTTNIQNLSYTYDAVGNITSIVDSSDTRTAGESTYTYDDLYRLTSATLDTASTTTTHTYQYTPTGNITSFNGTPYTYTGNTGSSYANPHAATAVGTTPYTYSSNGNLLSDNTFTHQWDYRNRLTSSTDGTNTSTYQYNHLNQRTKLVEGSDTTLYPFSSYHIENGTPKLYLSLGTVPVATIQGTTTAYLHTNHLTSTTKTTDPQGAITKTLDYHPYGSVRLETGVQEETKQYTGYTKDYATDLNYAGQRYYLPKEGRFMSQDPVFLAVGDTKTLEQKTNLKLEQYLKLPQTHNSYSYAANNPITLKDKDGEFVHIVIGAGAGILGQYGYDVYNNIKKDGFDASDLTSNLSSAKTYAARAAQGGVIAATGGLAAGAGIGIAGQVAIVGGTSGITGVAANSYLDQPISAEGIFFDTVVGASTFGLGSAVPKVPGRLPNFGTPAFFTGKHTQQSALNLTIDANSNYLSAVLSDLIGQIKILQEQKKENKTDSNRK